MKSENNNRFLGYKMNKILENDINELISHKKYFENFTNSTFLVTGATGLIGSILVKTLLRFSQKNNSNIKVYACCRKKEKFQKVFEDYFTDNLIPIFCDITELNISSISIDYIVHGASITDSKTFVQKPVETINIAFDGTRNLLSQCVNKKIKGFVYLSSLEVYGSFNNEKIKSVTENDYGFIDTMKVRSSYSESKRLVETLCVSYASEFNVPVKVARLCQTFGAGVEYNDNRVFAQFARSIIENKDIILKTKGQTVRNYCYTTDSVSGILTVLQKGKVGEAYNIANPSTTISIVDLANLFCSVYPECNSKVVFQIDENSEKLGFNPVVKIQLNTQKLENLNWKAEVNLENMLKRLIEGMK